MESNHGSDGRFKKGTHWREPKPWWDKSWLEKEYLRKQKSAAEIGAEYGCTENNILAWIKKHGIKPRTMIEVRSVKRWGADGSKNPMFGKCAEANPNWLGGVTPERQRDYSRYMWKQIKRFVLERDKYTCRRCGGAPVGKRSLHTHHPKAWKAHREERFNPDNIITLCRRCHEFVHSRRNADHEFLE